MACWKVLLSESAEFAFRCAIYPMISAIRSEAIWSASDSNVSEPVMTPVTTSAVIMVVVSTAIDRKRRESVMWPDSECSNSLIAVLNSP